MRRGPFSLRCWLSVIGLGVWHVQFLVLCAVVADIAESAVRDAMCTVVAQFLAKRRQLGERFNNADQRDVDKPLCFFLDVVGEVDATLLGPVGQTCVQCPNCIRMLKPVARLQFYRSCAFMGGVVGCMFRCAPDVLGRFLSNTVAHQHAHMFEAKRVLG